MITRIHIEGYKSLASVDLSRLDRLNILFGPNAAGKSNFLDALDLFGHLAREDTLPKAFLRHRGNRLDRALPLRWFFHGGNEERPFYRLAFELDLDLHPRFTREINAELKAREEREGVERSYTRVTQERLRYRLVLTYASESRTLLVTEESLTPLTRDGQEHSTIVPYIKFDPDGSRATVKLERQSHPRHFPFPRERTILAEVGDIVNHPHLVAVARELSSVRVYYVEPTRMRREVSDIGATDPGPHGESLASFYHWLSRTDAVGYQNLQDNLVRFVADLERVEVREATEGFLELWVHERSRGAFPAALVSEGTLRLLCLLGIAATPRPPAVVGYEEPENGVSPSRLLELIDIIRRSADDDQGPQFFLTTHSPQVLDAVGDAVRFRVAAGAQGSRFERAEELPLLRKLQEQEALANGGPGRVELGKLAARGDLD